MPLHLQIAAQLGKIVDLAVVGDPDSPVFVAHGHVPAGGKINNGKSPASKADIGTVGKFLLPQSGVVGPPMSRHVSLPHDRFSVSRATTSAVRTNLSESCALLS